MTYSFHNLYVLMFNVTVSELVKQLQFPVFILTSRDEYIDGTFLDYRV